MQGNIGTMRFSAYEWAKPENRPSKIMVVGQGAVGSNLSYFLGRIGDNLVVFDGDNFSIENMSGQFCSMDSIGINKAQACFDLSRRFSGGDTAMTAFAKHWEKEDGVINSVISAADSMTVRKNVFEAWSDLQVTQKVFPGPDFDKRFFMDFRMTATTGQVFFITNGRQAKEYTKHLFDSSEAEQLPCNVKASTHNGALLVALGTSIINNYMANIKFGIDVYEVPFMTSWNADDLSVTKQFV